MAYQKADAGRGSNTESGIAKPYAPFHHSHRAVFFRLIRHCRSWMSSESSNHGHTKRINPTIWFFFKEFYSIFLSLMCVYSFQTLNLDLVSVHASQVLMSAKRSIVYSPISKCCLHSLYMTMFEWLGWYLWHKMAFKMSQDIKHYNSPPIRRWLSTPEICGPSANPRSPPLHAEVYWWRQNLDDSKQT